MAHRAPPVFGAFRLSFSMYMIQACGTEEAKVLGASLERLRYPVLFTFRYQWEHPHPYIAFIGQNGKLYTCVNCSLVRVFVWLPMLWHSIPTPADLSRFTRRG